MPRFLLSALGAVREVWARIEAVLRPNAPNLLAVLPAGASPEAIAAAEQRLGFRFPADVRDSYAVHDGSGGAHDGRRAEILPHYVHGFIDVPMLSLAECV